MQSLWCMSHYQGYIRIVSVILRFSLSLHPKMFSTWKRMPKSLDSYSKVFKSLIFSYCTTLTVSEQITPICFSKKISKQIICILSLTPVCFPFFLSFLKSWKLEIFQLEFLWSASFFVFFLLSNIALHGSGCVSLWASILTLSACFNGL